MGWDSFKKLMNWGLKYVVYFAKEIGGNFLKIIMKHPWVTMYATFICAIFALLSVKINQFGKTLNKWGNILMWLITLLLFILIVILGAKAVEAESFKTLGEAIKKIVVLRPKLSSFEAHKEPDLPSIRIHSNSAERPKNDNWKNFVFFSVLTSLTAKFFLRWFKKKLVGDGPGSDALIDFIDNHPLENIPQFEFFKYFSKSKPSGI